MKRLYLTLKLLKKEIFFVIILSIVNVGLCETLKRIFNKFSPLLNSRYHRRMVDKESALISSNQTDNTNLLISIIMPVYNTHPYYLEQAIFSVVRQTSRNWELIIVNDASYHKETNCVLESFSTFDPKIKILNSEKNIGIAAATNYGISISKGTYITFLDHDDLLVPNALEIISHEILQDGYDMLYSDEDKVDLDGKFVEPFRKPDWSPELLLSCNYITHLSVYRKEVGDEIGWLNSEFDGSQDYDLVLRFTEKTQHINHIPHVLYHWRKSISSTALRPKAKNYAFQSGERSLQASLNRRDLSGTVTIRPGIPGHYRVKLDFRGSAIVLSAAKSLNFCISDIYPIRDMKFASNDATIITQLIQVIRDFSRSYVVFLGHPNKDFSINDRFIEELLSYLQIEGIGFVGATVINKNGRIVSSGYYKVNTNMIPYGAALSWRALGYFGSMVDLRNVDSVDAEAWAIRSDVLFSALLELEQRRFVFSTFQETIDVLADKLKGKGYRHVVVSSAHFVSQKCGGLKGKKGILEDGLTNGYYSRLKTHRDALKLGI